MSRGQANGWKVLAAGMAVLAGLCLAAGAMGAEIRNVTAKQRYPWNGLVDIRFTVSGIGEGEAWPLSVSAVEPDSGSVRELSNYWVVRDGTNSSDRAVSANGECEVLWDAQADLGEVVFSNMVVQVTFGERPMFRLWEGGPYWADRNVGAEEPWEYGFYFWWGDAVGFRWEDNQWVATDGSASGFSFEIANAPTYKISNAKLLSQGWITEDGVLAPEHDAARMHWGGRWRMPTGQELSDLREKCDRTWVTANGVKGYVVRGRGDYAAASIFLPASGWGNGAEWTRGGEYGYLLSSDPLTDGRVKSYRIIYRSGQFTFDDYFDRFLGLSCRPVQGGGRP